MKLLSGSCRLLTIFVCNNIASTTQCSRHVLDSHSVSWHVSPRRNSFQCWTVTAPVGSRVMAWTEERLQTDRCSDPLQAYCGVSSRFLIISSVIDLPENKYGLESIASITMFSLIEPRCTPYFYRYDFAYCYLLRW